MSGYVVVNEVGYKLNLGEDAPQILYPDPFGNYRIFEFEVEAEQALADTCYYEWRNLCSWETHLWKIVPLEELDITDDSHY